MSEQCKKENEQGDSQEEVPLEVWLGSDPELALMVCDMDAWDEAHPCLCNAICTCR